MDARTIIHMGCTPPTGTMDIPHPAYHRIGQTRSYQGIQGCTEGIDGAHATRRGMYKPDHGYIRAAWQFARFDILHWRIAAGSIMGILTIGMIATIMIIPHVWGGQINEFGIIAILINAGMQMASCISISIQGRISKIADWIGDLLAAIKG